MFLVTGAAGLQAKDYSDETARSTWGTFQRRSGHFEFDRAVSKLTILDRRIGFPDSFSTSVSLSAALP